MAQFKGRVIERRGTIICIDTKVESREVEGKVITSAWPKPEYPKINAVVRCNFHNRDKD